MCRLYGVTRAGYYARRARGESRHGAGDRHLAARIREIHEASRATYGSPRIHRALRAQGVWVGKKRIERLMREQGMKARTARLYHANPGAHAFFAAIPNRELDRLAEAPDRVWVGDITYLKVGSHWRYLAVVMDKYSRRVIGWSLRRHKNASLTLSALSHAVQNRRPRPGVIFHTDRGIEYAAYAFRARLTKLGFTQSMNRPGTLADNAHMESFFHSMKSDVFHGHDITSDEQLARLLRTYIPFYNRSRLHSALGYRSPVDYERQTE